MVTVELRSPDDVLAAVPYLLGFHPEDSLVLIWVRDSVVVLTQRIDFAVARTHPFIGQELAETAQPSDVRDVIVAAFTPTFDDAEVAILQQVVRGLRSASMTVLDAMHCVDGHWSSLHRDAAGTHRVPVQADTERIAADFTLHGRQVYPNRSWLLAEITPDPDLARSVAAVIGPDPSPEATANWGVEFLAGCTGRWREPMQTDVDPMDVARYVCLIQDIGSRDAFIWVLVQCGDDELSNAAAWMRRAVQGVTGPHVAPAATMSALASWLCGDGARAQSGLERALEADPTYVLAGLLSRALGSGMPPRLWRESVAKLTLKDCIEAQMR